MSGKRIIFFMFLAASIIVLAAIPPKPQHWGRVASNGAGLVIGRNVNMVSGQQLPDGDPYLQRQNEPSVAVSTRNPIHLLAGANDYRTIDIPFADEYAEDVPGVEYGGSPYDRDAWLGAYTSDDGGHSWKSKLLPGFPQDQTTEGMNSPLKRYGTAADAIVIDVEKALRERILGASLPQQSIYAFKSAAGWRRK